MALAVNEFQLLLVQLAADLGIKIGRLLTRMDRLDRGEALAFITEAYPELVLPYLAASGELSVQFYNEQPTVSDFLAESIDLIPDERLAVSGRWALTQNSPVQALVGSAGRAVMDQSRQTILENLAEEYDVPMVEIKEPGTRWARHASPNACPFCRMAATRGAVFRSAESATTVVGRSVDLTTRDRRMRAAGLATTDELLERRETYSRGSRKGQARNRPIRGERALGSKYHDNCACTAVPVRPGQDYEPPAYVEAWEDQYRAAVKAARDAGMTKGDNGAIDVNAVLSAWGRDIRQGS